MVEGIVRKITDLSGTLHILEIISVEAQTEGLWAWLQK